MSNWLAVLPLDELGFSLYKGTVWCIENIRYPKTGNSYRPLLLANTNSETLIGS